MKRATAIREQIESALAQRIPTALSPAHHGIREVLRTGIAEVDTLLDGGLPLGSVVEIIGPVCSGRTTIVLSVLAGITGQGATAAYVDVSDTFDPVSAAAMGIDLSRLLWVRARGREKDRSGSVAVTKSWDRLDRALCATDLLLNTGGFRAIVVDMCDVHQEQARRMPLASWYRFRLQAEKLHAILLLVAQRACASSCASVVLRCTEADERWQYANDAAVSLPLLTGIRYRTSVERKRERAQESFDLLKKRPLGVTETSWNGTTIWTR